MSKPTRGGRDDGRKEIGALRVEDGRVIMPDGRVLAADHGRVLYVPPRGAARSPYVLAGRGGGVGLVAASARGRRPRLYKVEAGTAGVVDGHLVLRDGGEGAVRAVFPAGMWLSASLPGRDGAPLANVRASGAERASASLHDAARQHGLAAGGDDREAVFTAARGRLRRELDGLPEGVREQDLLSDGRALAAVRRHPNAARALARGRETGRRAGSAALAMRLDGRRPRDEGLAGAIDRYALAEFEDRAERFAVAAAEQFAEGREAEPGEAVRLEAEALVLKQMGDRIGALRGGRRGSRWRAAAYAHGEVLRRARAFEARLRTSGVGFDAPESAGQDGQGSWKIGLLLRVGASAAWGASDRAVLAGRAEALRGARGREPGMWRSALRDLGGNAAAMREAGGALGDAAPESRRLAATAARRALLFDAAARTIARGVDRAVEAFDVSERKSRRGREMEIV